MNLQSYIVSFGGFVSGVLIPFLIGIAFLMFVINAIRFFVLGSADQEGRDKAKRLALYGVLTFVVLIVFWGVINLLGSSSGLSGATGPTADYLPIGP